MHIVMHVSRVACDWHALIDAVIFTADKNKVIFSVVFAVISVTSIIHWWP